MICRACRAALRISPSTFSTPRRLGANITNAQPPRLRRLLSSMQPVGCDEPSPMSASERAIADLLAAQLRATHVLVQDVSGGCGTMYAVHVASPLFRGLSLLKQQRMVNAALGDVVKTWHGLHIRTVVPPEDS